jgi:hypothetical protein
VISERTVSSQYDLDGRLAMRIEIDRPRFARFPASTAAVNYCAFRGMLMKSSIYFRARGGINLPFSRSARLRIGDHPRVARLKELGIAQRPLFAVWLPETGGVLDDHYEGWFLSSPEPPSAQPEGMESVVGLDLGQEWLPPPNDPALDGAKASTKLSR